MCSRTTAKHKSRDVAIHTILRAVLVGKKMSRKTIFFFFPFLSVYMFIPPHSSVFFLCSARHRFLSRASFLFIVFSFFFLFFLVLLLLLYLSHFSMVSFHCLSLPEFLSSLLPAVEAAAGKLCQHYPPQWAPIRNVIDLLHTFAIYSPRSRSQPVR